MKKTGSSLFSQVLAYARITKSSLGAKNGHLLFDTVSLGDERDERGADSDVRDGQEAYSGPVVFRPPAGKDRAKPDLLLEALAARTSDGLVPFAFRDERILYWLNRGSDTPSVPKAGQVVYPGYGGAMLSFEVKDSANGPVNVVVLYCPYDRDSNGVPQKAHMVMLDPTPGNEAVALVHALGLAITMTEADGIVLRADETTRLVVKPGSIAGSAGSISWQGNVALGANTATAIPLIPGAATQATPSVFFSPV